MKKLFLCLLLSGCIEGYRSNFHTENDIFNPNSKNDDKYFTHGTRFGVAKEDRNERQDYSIGQNIYTPSRKHADADPEILKHDRPYAGWLYSEYRDRIRNSDTLQTTFGIQLGCLGPCSFARQTQQNVHRAIGMNVPAWQKEYSLKSEPGFILELEREKELYAYRDHFDIVLGALGKFGNIIDSAGVYSTVRVGTGFDAFASIPIVFKTDPQRASTSSRRDREITAYLFGRIEERGVAYNQLLDGSLFQDEPHTVTSKPFVNELNGGFTLGYGPYKFTYTLIRFSSEWKEKQTPFMFGSIDFQW